MENYTLVMVKFETLGKVILDLRDCISELELELCFVLLELLEFLLNGSV